ncbi:MAG: carbon-nitrogen hydrolase family protein [Bacteriovoracaceae bacterium]|nr:carbon-nitrogen hydrolase family protein [Bacteriovoracaceae bacterium]
MRIAVLQMNSKEDFQENLKVIRSHAEEAVNQAAKMLFLPECFYSMSNGLKPTPYLVDEHNEHYENIRAIAKDFGISLVGGSAATNLNGSVVNRAYNFDALGNPLSHYDKINLFSCDIQKEGQRKAIDEADIYTAGKIPQLIAVGGIKVGLGICFDLRYPEMARQYVREGAQILTFSSAFTVPTGKAHWHTLLRARAIENQCFVVAAAQYGLHNERIQTFGHSLVVDPWGDVLLDAKEGVGLHVVDLEMDRIETIRKSVKVFK